jgi:hypothetical protein
MAAERGGHSLRDPSRACILLDHLAETPRGGGVTPSRCKQGDGLLGALAFPLWRAFPTEVRRQEVRAILGSLALVHAPVTRLQSPIDEAEPDECRVADSGIEEAWQHDQRGEVLRLPDRLLYCDPFRLRSVGASGALRVRRQVSIACLS